MPRSRKSIATTHLFGNAPAASTSAKARVRNSFAAPTSASIARGGPTDFAPSPPKPTARKPGASKMASSDVGNKENHSENTYTPKKASDGAAILSPIPYHCVLSERGGKTSPRITRSAAKMRESRARTMEQLDALEDDSDDDSDASENEEEMTAAYGRTLVSKLQFSPPGKKHQDLHMKKLREEEEEKARMQETRIRKAREAGLNFGLGNSTPEKVHVSRIKRAKKGVNSSTNEETTNSSANQFNEEHWRQLMNQFMEANETKIAGVIESAKLSGMRESDVVHLKERIEQLEKTTFQLTEENTTLKAECSELKASADVMKRDYSDLTEKFHQLELELEASKNENEVLLATAASNDDQSKVIEKKISELERENSSLAIELDKTKLSFAEERSAMGKKIEDITEASNAKIQDLQQSLLQEQKHVVSKEEIIQERERELASATKRIQILEDEVNTTKQRMDGMQSPRGMKAAQDEVDRLRADLIEAKKTTTEWEIKASELCNQLESTKKEMNGQLEVIAGKNEVLIAEIKATKIKLNGQLEEKKAMANDMNSKLSSVNEEKALLVAELEQTKIHLSHLESEYNIMVEKLNKSEQCREKSDEAVNHKENQVQNLTSQLEGAKTTIAGLNETLHQKQAYVDRFETTERHLRREIQLLNEVRRRLHNRVMQLSGNIRVFVRVRPLIPIELELTSPQNCTSTSVVRRPSSSSSASCPSSRGSHCGSSGYFAAMFQPISYPDLADVSASLGKSNGSSENIMKQAIEVVEPPKDRGGLKQRNKAWRYYFDRVFDPSQTQEDVWTAAEPLIQSAVDGFPVCMFAYGQTGSGKTHTMIGDEENPGLVPRAVEKLFNAKRELEMNPGCHVSIKIELLEIYNEEVRDLLDSRSGPDGQLIKLKLNCNETVGNIIVSADDKKEVSEILELAQKRRCVKATKSNSQSSRSHLLFTIHFEVDSDSESLNHKGCIRIVDLAGSERLEKSGSTGVLAKEAKYINSSLLALKGVISKLQAKEKHIPYRDSKLTYLLRDSLGGDSKTLAIVCCSPHVIHYHESSSSIKFAYDASKVELKKSHIFTP
ncbi:hypothetical protein ACHAXS_006834 [Conticribra weissflogii]